MILEDQVCSLELAKRLKELGVRQLSIFKWIKANHPTEKTCEPAIQHSGALEDSYDEMPISDGWTLTSWAAFTVAELGQMLPKYITQNKTEYYYTQIPSSHCDVWIIYYRNSFNSAIGVEVEDKSEANARAKILIYLIENKLMEVPI